MRTEIVVFCAFAIFPLLGCTPKSEEVTKEAFFTPKELSLPKKLIGKIPFDLEKLAKPPKYRWDNQSDSVWSLYYEGDIFQGKQTEVFAYYASPATLKGEKNNKGKYPLVVTIHGGGGTAFYPWVKGWAERGYAAISMDLSGAKPLPMSEQPYLWGTKSKQLSRGAPDDTREFKLYHIDDDFSNQWQFHAISNAIRAHSLARSFSEVDTTKTVVTGVSWGGYLTNILAGIDQRFKAAVPIYGCGFLNEKSYWLPYMDTLGLVNAKKWISQWDPSSYVGNTNAEMLYVNGTNDFAYHAESWQKTIDLVPNAKQLMILEMKHNHSEGVFYAEIEAFFKGTLNKYNNIPIVERPVRYGSWFEASLQHDEKINEAKFIYTEDTGKNKERKWQVKPAVVENGLLKVKTSLNTKLGYFLITYADDSLRVSSPLFND